MELDRDGAELADRRLTDTELDQLSTLSGALGDRPGLRADDQPTARALVDAGDLQTSIVTPLYRANAAELLTLSTVDVRFDDSDLVASVPELAAINNRSLRNKAGTAIAYEDEFRRALDRLFTDS